MPRCVLYTEDLIPITVIDLPAWGIDMLRDGDRFKVPVMEPVMSKVCDEKIISSFFKEVTIWGEPMYRGNRRSMLLFTDDEELALKLSAEMLPGQQKEFQAQYRKGFIDAIIRTLGA